MRHKYVTKRDELVCDFCSRPGVAFAYPCEDGVTLVVVGGRSAHVATSYGGWAACAECAPIVDVGDPGRLALHVVRRGSVPRRFWAAAKDSLATLYVTLLPLLGKPEPVNGDWAAGDGMTVQIVEED